MEQLSLGTAVLEPSEPVIAGSYVCLTYTYTTGHPIDDSGYVKIAFRQLGDFGSPQFDDPLSANYCTVRTTGDCQILPRWDRKGHTRPWSFALYLRVTRGYLDTGDQVVVVFGDRCGGSPGWQMQTFREHTFEFKTLVDPIATYEFKELPLSPTLRVVAGPPDRAVCIAPSQVLAGQPFEYHLKLEDRWGNPTAPPARILHPGLQPGMHTVTGRDKASGLSAVSNPIAVQTGESTPKRYWADFHGQSEETIGTNSINDYLTFARDYALLDLAGHQGNDFQVTDELWDQINGATARYNDPGRFVTFPGYEWSGNTPLGGDRNVYYTTEGGAIFHSCYDLLPGKTSAYPAARTAAELFARLAQTLPGESDSPPAARLRPQAFAWAHVGGRYADMDMHDEDVELAVEIHSSWGTFDWLLEESLERGYRVGVVAGSDDHKCRPGAAYPGSGEFGSLGGLTCVLAPKLDRESIFAALRARHMYATTGHRPWIDLRISFSDGQEATMGDVITARGVPHMHLQAVGTAPIESIEVHNGLHIMRTLRPYGSEDVGNRVKILWSGAEVKGRARMCRWDGWLQVRGNTIEDFAPINFWNANQPMEELEPGRLTWKSMTTGGPAGAILTLREPYAGSLTVHTAQRQVTCSLRGKLYNPRLWELGGLRKRISIYRLPASPGSHRFQCSLPLRNLPTGENPIFLRLIQEDGHIAWTSPVFVTRSG